MTCAVDMIIGETENGYKRKQDVITTILTSKWIAVKVNQSRYRPGVTQRVPGS